MPDRILYLAAYAGPAELIEARLYGLLAAFSAELLAEVGLDAQRWTKLDFAFDLVGNLANLLGWAVETPVLKVLEAHDRGKPEMA